MTKRPVILIVDDGPENIRQLRGLLQNEATIVFARDGAEALRQAAAHQPALILLDVVMPGMDGHEVCRQLKADDALAAIPVIFVTSADGERDEARGLELGAIDYITKPFSPAIIRARVRNQLALAAVAEDLGRSNDSLRKFKAAVDCSSATIVIANRDGVIEYVNAAFSHTSGYAAADAVHHHLQLFWDYPGGGFQELWGKINAGDTWRGQLRNRRREGRLYWEEVAVSPVHDGAGRITHFIAVSEDVTRRKRTEEELLRLAITDPLTGLSNRRHFLGLGQEEILRARRTGQPLAVLFLDIDHFKAVNDRWGHRAGDQVIRGVASICQESVREIDRVGRLGGEELAIALPNTPDGGGAELAERIRLAIESTPFLCDGVEIHCTVSVGITATTTAREDFETLLKQADDALYLAKRSGRNRVEHYRDNSFLVANGAY